MAKLKGVMKLSDEIEKALKTYTREVTEGMEAIQKDVGKESVAKLKSNSPRDTGKYAKGWRLKRTSTGYTIHNATSYQLTHLLEKPHAKRNGGRSTPIPHIGPVEDWAIDEYVKRTEELVRG